MAEAARNAAERFLRAMPMRLVRSRPRFFLCALAGVLVGVITPGAWQTTTRSLVGWDAALVLFFATVGVMMMRADGDSLRRRAQDADEGRFAILVVGILVALISFGAIAAELGIAKDMQRLDKATHVGLAIVTIVLSWFFLHFIFALHYANEFFLECDMDGDGTPDLRGGLHFPIADENDAREPDFSDFLYYAYTIGVAAQTADVETTSTAMRRVTLAHSIVSFFFNTAILALAINMAAGLL